MPIVLSKLIEQSEYSYENKTDAYNEWNVVSHIPKYERNCATHCVCGKKIHYQFLVRNKHNQKENILGGKCIEKIIDLNNYNVNSLQALHRLGLKKWERKLTLYNELEIYRNKYGWEHNLTLDHNLHAFIYVVGNFRERKRQLEIFIHNYTELIRNKIYTLEYHIRKFLGQKYNDTLDEGGRKRHYRLKLHEENDYLCEENKTCLNLMIEYLEQQDYFKKLNDTHEEMRINFEAHKGGYSTTLIFTDENSICYRKIHDIHGGLGTVGIIKAIIECIYDYIENDFSPTEKPFIYGIPDIDDNYTITHSF